MMNEEEGRVEIRWGGGEGGGGGGGEGGAGGGGGGLSEWQSDTAEWQVFLEAVYERGHRLLPLSTSVRHRHWLSAHQSYMWVHFSSGITHTQEK